jgi:type IV secretory pathway VirB10-like protein
MAFVKKTATKTPAQYARTKQSEAQEVEEVLEDVVEEGEGVPDDYAGEDETEAVPAPAPPRPVFRRPVQAPSSAPVRQAQNKSENQSVRLTGLFAGKREGCFSGKLRGEDMANLKALIESAQSSNQEVVFFLWENQPEQGRPLFNLTANISAPVQKKWGGRGGNFGGQNRGFRRY